MAIVGGMDVHRNQITFDYLDTETGEVSRGELQPATRSKLRVWLQRFQDREAAFALESRSWRPPASRHTSPSRQTPVLCVAVSVALLRATLDEHAPTLLMNLFWSVKTRATLSA